MDCEKKKRLIELKNAMLSYGYIDGAEELESIFPELAESEEQMDLSSGEDVMIMCNQILINWVKEGKTQEEKEQREQAHIRFFELYDDYLMQEQPEIEKEAEISPSMISNFGPCAFNLSVMLTQEEMVKMNIIPFFTKKVNVIIKDTE